MCADTPLQPFEVISPETNNSQLLVTISAPFEHLDQCPSVQSAPHVRVRMHSDTDARPCTHLLDIQLTVTLHHDGSSEFESWCRLSLTVVNITYVHLNVML